MSTSRVAGAWRSIAWAMVWAVSSLSVACTSTGADAATEWLELEELRTDLNISLDSGGRSMPVLVGFHDSVAGQYVEVEIDLGGFVDCDPGNNATPEFFLTGYDCGWYQ